MKATDDFGDEGKDAFVGDITTYDVVKDAVVDGGEELADVALEYPARAGVVARNLVGELPETVHRAVRPLSPPARIRIGDERTVKERIQFPIQCVVEQPVAHRRLVDVARFRVGDSEVCIPAVAIHSLFQLPMKRENIVH